MTFDPATANVLAQEALLASLRGARVAAGLSLEAVAERLGVLPQEAEQALTGQQDLTLTELRLLALACDAAITYTVQPATP